ncbi:GNAT family N-acetyltransferase [Halobacillus mangrovi]|uniref:GNAT family N-acetyltransferase n=1 Tax=Halobacillus mangrovi TaxID=402384 RepID=UPI003D99B8D0
MEQAIAVRPLRLNDRSALEAMDTGIEDDYVIRIFDRLIESEDHELFGLFQDKQMLAVGGYSLFGGNKFAMIGRLRSDRRNLKKGYATELLKPIIRQLKNRPEVYWVGANTQVDNIPARRVFEKLYFHQGPVLYYLTLDKPQLLTGNTPGSVWEKSNDVTEKRELLLSLKQNKLGVFPYECYYPLPYDSALFIDDYLNKSTFYKNKDDTRFVIIKNDIKKYEYSHVKYFWNDHYEQPGFFETVLDHWKQTPSNVGCWIDFSHQGFNNIPDLSPYKVQDPWILYEFWKDRH